LIIDPNIGMIWFIVYIVFIIVFGIS